jgi:hypothetical protein
MWFRYRTSVLVLIPWTVTAGPALLACTMASAALILTFVLGRPADSVFSVLCSLFLTAFWWERNQNPTR